MILYEKEICEQMRLPSIPKKEWDGKSSFKNGVAVVKTLFGDAAYAVASFDADFDKEPRIKKVFGQEIFREIMRVFVVPEYMDVDCVKDADLDDVSKKRAEELAKEAKEIEDEGLQEEVTLPDNEYMFDNIHNDDEAKAFIQSYNSRNRIKGRIPSTHEGIVMRLSVIYADTQNKSK